nr:hypothetical protein CFP56_14877 [Quercus suber]
MNIGNSRIYQEARRCDREHEEVHVAVLEAMPVATPKAMKCPYHLLSLLLLQDHEDELCSSSSFEQRSSLPSSSLANRGESGPSHVV